MNINNLQPAVGASDAIPLEPIMPLSLGNKIEASQKTQDRQLSEKQQADLLKSKQENQKDSSTEEMKELAEEMNGVMDDLQTSLGFSIRENDLNPQVIIEIKNRETNELIKQIPSEELLTIKEKMEEFTGLIFDQSV